MKQRAIEILSLVLIVGLLFYAGRDNSLPVLVLAVGLIVVLIVLVLIVPLITAKTYSTFRLAFPPLKLLALIFLIYVGTASMFGLIYYFVNEESSHTAFGAALSIEQCIYFSFVTLATVGYGDIAPKTSVAMLTVVSEIVFGFFLVSVLLAVVVSKSIEMSGRTVEQDEGKSHAAPEQVAGGDGE